MSSFILRTKPLSHIAFLAIVMGLASQSLATIDVLVNQCGYEPASPKVFRAQRNADFASNGTFSVKRVSDNAVVSSGTLTRKGALWDKWYWEGDFSSYNTAGDYYVTAVVNGETANSYNFNIGNNTLRSQTGVLVYRYFLTQRCGSAVTDPYDGVFWHGQCHMDDGVRSGPYQHMDAVGGWHDAGDYGKYAHGFAASGVNGLLWLYDNNRSYYDGFNVDGNGIPDIIDEALYQARWLAKMVDDSSGHILQQTRQNRTGASFVRPESDTNNVICNCNSASSCDACDDRWIDNGTEATPQEMACCAALIKMHVILASKGLPTENFAAKAQSIWNHRVALAISEGGHNNLGNGPDQTTAGLDLFNVFGCADCYNRALQKVDETANGLNSNPAEWDSMNYGEVPSEVAVLAWFARTYPATSQATNARNAVIAYMNHNINYNVAGNPIGLCRREDTGGLQYFPTNSDNDAFFLGINRFYLMMTWASLEAYRLVGDPAYLRFGVDQYNWVMGGNYNRVCMMDGAGDFNPYHYHHRYHAIPGHECSKQPGVVPNGYVRTFSTGLPQFDLTTDCSQQARYQTNESWLINNASYAYAISQFFVMNGSASQAPFGGTARAIPGTIQAEDFDDGGEGVAYHDISAGNSGGAYRSTDVDIEATTDTGGGYNVGFIDTGEWLEYTVNVASTGDYAIKMRVASAGTGGTFHVSLGATNTAVKAFSGTGGWQTWTTIIVPGIFINSGNNQVLRVTIDSGGWNFNSVDFAFGGADVVSVDLDATDVNDGMNRVANGDGNTTSISIGGHNCRKNTSPSADFYMYFAIPDAYALNGNKASADLTFDYYDTGSGSLMWQYDGAGSAYTSGPSVALTNSNTWKTVTMHVNDAYFGNRENGGADFRIAAPVGLTWYLDTLMVFAQAGSLPGQATSPSPTNAATGVSITSTLSWTAGSGATSHDVRFGTTNPPPFIINQAGTTYNPGTMSANTTYFWRIDEKNAAGTTTGTVWSFTTLPLPGTASTPNPTNGATGVSTTPTLSWTAGSNATSHDVRFGTANPPPFIQNQAPTSYSPSTLSNNTTYFWRIDEKNSSGTTTGTVWSFTTAASTPTYFVNSSFESGFSAAGGSYVGSVGTGWTPYIYGGAQSDFTFSDETGAGNVDTGFHSQKIQAAAGKEGGVYNRFSVTNGLNYTVTVRVKSGSPAAWCFFGINTSGGTDPHEASGTIYPANNSRSTSWQTFTWTGTATGSFITLFLDTYDGVGYWDTATPGPVTVSNSAFASSADGWNIVVWHVGPNADGTMAFEGGTGNPAGDMLSGGSGATNSTDSCTREGGEINKAISTAGYGGLVQVQYDLRFNTDQSGTTCIGSCTPLEGNCADKIAVYYSTAGTGGPWTLLEAVNALSLTQNVWSTRTINCPAGANNQANFALRFRFQFNTVTVDNGRLDNIKVIGTP